MPGSQPLRSGVAVLAAFAVAVAAWAGTTLHHAAAQDAPAAAVVATIDGHPVPVRELDLFLVQDRAATFAYYLQSFGVSDGAHFWTTPHGGQTPRDHLTALAIGDLTRTVVQQEWARGLGLPVDASYPAFLAGWAAENSRRARAVASHQVVYGPVHYTEADYFQVVLAGMVTSLQQTLVSSGVVATTDAQLHPYYLAHLSDFPQVPTGSVALPHPGASSTTTPFAQVRAQVEQDYVNAWYAGEVSRRAASAKVSIVSAVLNRVPIQ